MKNLIIALIFLFIAISEINGQDKHKENFNILICDTKKPAFRLSDLEECSIISIKGVDHEVASFWISIPFSGGLVEHKITGNRFEERVFDDIRKYKAGKNLYIENVVMTDGVEVEGFRMFSLVIQE